MSNDFPFGHFIEIKAEPDRLNNQFGRFLNTSQDNNPPLNKNVTGQKDIQDQDNKNLNSILDLQTMILSLLKENINSQKYNAYFSETLFLKSYSKDQIVFETTTLFIKKMIENYYINQLQEVIFLILKTTPEIVINLAQKTSSFEEEKNINKILKTETEGLNRIARSAKEATFSLDLLPTHSELQGKIDSQVISHLSNAPKGGLIIDPKKTFENFIVGPSNNLVVASAHSICNEPGKAFPSLYIHGGSGLGKTHILHAIANTIKETHPGLRICYVSTTDFLNDMVESMGQTKMSDFRKRYTELVDVLMIDDIHELKGKPSTQNEFFYVFNELHSRKKQLIFTSDRPPSEIEGIEERIKTRLSWGLVLDIQPPDLETRIAIIRKKAQQDDIYLSEDVVYMIAESIKSNIREIEGSLIRLSAYSSIFKVGIDLEIAREQLKLKNSLPTGVKTIESIAKVVAAYYKTTVADLRSKVRTKDVTLARHIAMHLSYKIIGATLSEIGFYFGNRDHSSVLHAIEKTKSQISISEDVALTIREIERQINLST